MIREDYHIHTNYSDGKNSPEEIILAAIAAGRTSIGISDHAYTFFDESYCIPKEKLSAYAEEVRALAEKYAPQIRVKCGIEQDYYSEEPTDPYDYVIGSVHYMKFGEDYIPVDEGSEVLLAAAEKYCGGDIYTLIGEYYRTVGDVVRKTGASIIGHLDLITKFSERAPIYDTADPRYIRAWQAAVDQLLATGATFEINSGAITRGYRTTPYPSEEIRAYIREKGGRFILSSDSHSAADLTYLDQLVL